ncbi:CAP domain-containing protein [Eggerthellaceae bacterium 24-137]
MIALSKGAKSARGGVARDNRLICGVLAVALTATMTVLPARPAEAATADYQIPVTYGQTEARSMLSMINDFRASDAKCWNEDDTAQVAVGKQPALAYDYALEQAAMLRAAEIAVSFSHTRPNGTLCFTAFSSLPLYTYGENIAAGQTTAAAAFTSWREDDYGYAGQGHRRNMLDAGFTAIGIGHVTFNGIHYWVQNFGSPVVNATPTTAANGARTVAVSINDASITQKSLKASPATLSVTAGKSAALPALNASMVVQDNWPTGKLSFAAINPTWTSSNSAVAAISGNTVVGKKAGTATLTASANGVQTTATVTVKAQPSSAGASKPAKPSSAATSSTAKASKPPATKLSSVRGAKKSLKIKWKKQTKNVTGYEIWCSTSKKFTKKTTVKKTVKKAKTTSLTVKKLKAKKTYYVKVRTYYKDKVTGKTLYSSWTKAKKAKTKR